MKDQCRITEKGKGRCPFPIYVTKHRLCKGHYRRLVRGVPVAGLLRARRDLSLAGGGVTG